MSARLGKPPELRAYQREICSAVVRSVADGAGRSFSVMVARQGGKNEISAYIEAVLLIANAERGGTLVKTAPTLSPQLGISKRRLLERLRRGGLREMMTVQGETIGVGAATITFLSGQVDANVVGHTASLLLEVDEAQDIDADKFERDFRPMVLATGATVVFYGTAWEPNSLLERVKARHLELEARDGIRRHFEYDYRAVARDFPEYEARALEQRALLGEASPIWLSQYCLLPQEAINKLFTLEELAGMRGEFGEYPQGNFAPESHAERVVETGNAWVGYVAGLDIGGAMPGPDRDPTVLTIARVFEETSPLAPLPRHGAQAVGRGEHGKRAEVIKIVAWQSAWDDILVDLLRWNRFFRFEKVAVDATGLGHHAALSLERELGSSRVERVNFSEGRKSDLCYELRDAVEGGRLLMYKGENRHTRLFWEQLATARMETRNRTGLITFGVTGQHDDYLISLALCVRAMGVSRRRVAVGFTRR
ncbi:MAG: hypothetical protein WEB00_14505 [Dehalococcoidia bacterium]